MTSSHGSDRKSPPGPVKIYHFEKRPPRPPVPEERDGERIITQEFSMGLELSLQPDEEEAAPVSAPPGSPPPREPASQASGSPLRAQPVPRGPGRHPPAPFADGSIGASYVSGLLAERLAVAQKLFAQGHLTQARGMLEKLAALGVGGAALQTLLGTIYMAQGVLERAVASFNEALELDPSDLTARLYRGEIRLGWGDLLLAQEDLQYVLESGTAGSPIVQQARRLLQRLIELRERKRR
ncbi:MAG: tetratricopeptide repeat protein [Myxococcaceae bacterium]|nr:tetratricopeptide repeat protein [Myxococcaceae bacterium]